jgi:hypothetical protein
MSVPNRRDAFVKVAAVGAGVAVTAGVATADQPKKPVAKLPYAHTLQTEWRWCKKCEGLFFAGNAKNGVCLDGKEHDPSESGHYSMIAAEGGQSGWRRCKSCESLFFGADGRRGQCPAGAKHDPDTTDYTMPHAGA